MTDKEILKTARKYKYRAEWYASDQKTYTASRVRGKKFHEEACSHMPLRKPSKKAQKYSDKDLIDDALRFQYRVDWFKQSHNMYRLAHKRNLLAVACAHMLSKAKDGRIKQVLPRYVYVYFFRNDCGERLVYVGLTSDVKRREREHVSRGYEVGVLLATSRPYRTLILGPFKAAIAAEVEHAKVAYYNRNKKFRVLNACKAGALGFGL